MDNNTDTKYAGTDLMVLCIMIGRSLVQFNLVD